MAAPRNAYAIRLMELPREALVDLAAELCENSLQAQVLADAAITKHGAPLPEWAYSGVLLNADILVQVHKFFLQPGAVVRSNAGMVCHAWRSAWTHGVERSRRLVVHSTIEPSSGWLIFGMTALPNGDVCTAEQRETRRLVTHRRSAAGIFSACAFVSAPSLPDPPAYSGAAGWMAGSGSAWDDTTLHADGLCGLRMASDGTALFVASPMCHPIRKLSLADGTLLAEGGTSMIRVKHASGLALTADFQYLLVSENSDGKAQTAGILGLRADDLVCMWRVQDREHPQGARPAGMVMIPPITADLCGVAKYTDFFLLAQPYSSELEVWKDPGPPRSGNAVFLYDAVANGIDEDTAIFDAPIALAVQGSWLYMVEEICTGHPSPHCGDDPGTRVLVLDLKWMLDRIEKNDSSHVACCEPACILSVLQLPSAAHLDSIYVLPDGTVVVGNWGCGGGRVLVLAHDTL